MGTTNNGDLLKPADAPVVDTIVGEEPPDRVARPEPGDYAAEARRQIAEERLTRAVVSYTVASAEFAAAQIDVVGYFQNPFSTEFMRMADERLGLAARMLAIHEREFERAKAGWLCHRATATPVDIVRQGLDDIAEERAAG